MSEWHKWEWFIQDEDWHEGVPIVRDVVSGKTMVEPFGDSIAEEYAIAEQVVTDHNQAEALRAGLQKARQLLAAFVYPDVPPLLWDPDNIGRGPECLYCRALKGHEPKCPWLAAKQYLEPPTQQPFRASQSHQEPR